MAFQRYTPPSPPGPPPTGKQYLWAVNDAANDWTVPAVGATGPIKHTSGYCINGQTKQGTEFQVVECSGAAIQDFVLEANGNVHMAGGAQYCLAVKSSGVGPAVISFKCNTKGNEEMVFTPSGGGIGTICDKNTGTDRRCLAMLPTDPTNSGHIGAAVQIWAKPQPNGGVAVLVLNAGNDGNITVPFNFSEIRYTGDDGSGGGGNGGDSSGVGVGGVGGGVGGYSSGATSVLDIWTGKTTTVATGATAYTTDSIAPHDSRFYLFSPSSSAASTSLE